MLPTILLSVAALTGFTLAQGTYSIDPSSVSQSDRQYWCDQNKAQCPLICLQQPGVTSQTTVDNDCDPKTLTYTCVCENNVAPNITQYSQTLPFFICQEWGNQCVSKCNGDNTCGANCRSQHPCGAQSPYLGNATLSTMSSTHSPTGSSTSKVPITGFGGPASTSKPNNSAGLQSFTPGAGMGLVTVVGSIFLGFAILL